MIFISYSRKDLKVAQQIVNDIQTEACAKCWIDLAGIESAAQFQDVIISAIDKSDAVLFLYSRNSKNSKYAKKEVTYASNSGKRVIPICIDKEPLAGWFLFEFGTIDYIDYHDETQRFKLIHDLKGWYGKKEAVIQPAEPIQRESRPNLSIMSKIILFGSLVILSFLLYKCVEYGLVKGNKHLSAFHGTSMWKNKDTIPLLFNYLRYIFALDFIAVVYILWQKVWSPMIVIFASVPAVAVGLFKYSVSISKMGYNPNIGALCLLIAFCCFVGILCLAIFPKRNLKSFDFTHINRLKLK